MYYIHHAVQNEEGYGVIALEGRIELTNGEDIEAELLNEITNLFGKTRDSVILKGIIFDLALVEFISEDCLVMLNKIKKTVSNHPIYFKNYSLFIETLLKDYNLLLQ